MPCDQACTIGADQARRAATEVIRSVFGIMAQPPLVTLQDVKLRFGAHPLFTGVHLAISRGERISLVGRNGSGKSTLMKVLAGEVLADSGELFMQPGAHVTYLSQDPDLGGYDTLADYVASGLPSTKSDALYEVDIILDEIGLDGSLDPASASGGEARRAALARALVSEPDILLLDEPTNHLDIRTIEWLEEKLKSFRGGFVLISHDRRFLERLTRTVLWLDRGIVRRLDKGFAHFDAWSDEVMRQEAEERAKLNKLIAEEAAWSVEGISARRTRNQGRMRRLQALRSERAEQIATVGSVKLAAASGQNSGKRVIEAKNISKSFGDRVIIGDFSTKIARGDRVGVVGPNGAGKSTLLKMLTGELAPDTGTVQLGTNLTPTYLDQKRSLLSETETVWETLSDGADQILVRGQPRHIVSYLKDFLFDATQARSPVSSLSGGERNRLLLAKTLAKPSNLLILDEPTNDLDMETLDLLQEMLSDYDGTLLLVSHDRDFLDRVVTSTIAMEGDGNVTEYAGGYTDYMHQRQLGGREAEALSETAKAANLPRTNVTTSSPKATPARAPKLSYKHQRALEQLPGQIAQLEADIKNLTAKLAAPDLYTRDPNGFSKLTKKLEEAENKLASAEEEWLELEMLREETGAQ